MLGRPEVDIRQAYHGYGSQPVLAGVDLQVQRGSIAAVLGESGSGKTTLLRVIAGFERLTSGQVLLGGSVVDDGRRTVRPERRRVGYVPQDGALFPHLRVAANVAFGMGRRARPRRVSELLELVGLSGLERRFPHELSGGQQQRVALARALAVDPSVVLLDEPFSALDAALRASIRAEVTAILRHKGTTTILVTHDQDEALSMADRVAVLRDGRVVAEGAPEELYRSPVDAELAEFLGEANLVRGLMKNGTVATSLGDLTLLEGLSVSLARSGDGSAGGAGAELTVLVRPEQLEVKVRDAASASAGAHHAIPPDAIPPDGIPPDGVPAHGIPARVLERAYFGHDAVLRVVTERSGPGDPLQPPLLARVTGAGAPSPGSEILIAVRGPVMAWAAAAG